MNLHGPWSAFQRFLAANLIGFGLDLINVRLELLLVLYPSLIFEKGPLFIIEIVQTLIQGLVVS
jgi:hypothetical protein